MAYPPITALPVAPSRSAAPEVFVVSADAFVAALPQFRTEQNALAQWEQDTAVAVAASQAAAAASANFKGLWTALTGALAVPATVYHLGSYWQLMSTIADVTTKIPGTASEWTRLFSVASDIGIQSGVQVTSIAAGTVNAITAAFTPAITSFFSGPLWFRAMGANTTTAPTFKIDALAVKTIVKGNNLPLAAGDISGAGMWCCVNYDATLDKMVLLNPATGVSERQIQPIAASVGSNALTLTLNPTSLGFRSTPLTSGTVNTRTTASAISVVVPSAATLGTIGAQASRLVLIAIDNAGVIELAVVNIAGGSNLDETTLITTTAISAAATSASVIYSTTARTGVPFRVVGFVDITETVAGTWATAPSTIQGIGGQALAAMSSLGYGQTWQEVSGSRLWGTTYYNTTGRPIQVIAGSQYPGAVNLAPTVNGVSLPASASYDPAYSLWLSVNFIVQPGASYSVASTPPGTRTWAELR